jgi:hypothetical protein
MTGQKTGTAIEDLPKHKQLPPQRQPCHQDKIQHGGVKKKQFTFSVELNKDRRHALLQKACAAERAVQ